MKEDMGGLSGSRERSQSPLSPPIGFDPGRVEVVASAIYESQFPDAWMGVSGIERDLFLQCAEAALVALFEEPKAAISRAYQMGGDSRQATISAWLRVAAWSRDDRADPDSAEILFGAADIVESGSYREWGESQ